jgi:hypothetical protein
VIGLEDPLDEPLLECPLVTVMDFGRLAPPDDEWESEMPLGSFGGFVVFVAPEDDGVR